MSDLAEFLLARIAEDEETAYPGCSWFTGRRYGLLDTGEYVSIVVADPEFVLAECEAKRRIIEHHARMPDPEGESAADLCAICSANGPHAQGWPCETLRLLALPYADHPDYREEWQPVNRVPVALAAHAAGVKPCTVRKWLSRGKLTRHRDGIDLAELLRCVDSRDPAALAVRDTPHD